MAPDAILNLDLRPVAPPTDPFQWDFPKFPAKVAAFIKNKKTIEVTIKVDTTVFHNSMSCIIYALSSAKSAERDWVSLFVAHQPSSRFRPMRFWCWRRIILWAGVIYAIAMGVWAWH
jgi:hypothetical protein